MWWEFRRVRHTRSHLIDTFSIFLFLRRDEKSNRDVDFLSIFQRYRGLRGFLDVFLVGVSLQCFDHCRLAIV